jgi:hypothetical protein
MNDTEKFHPTAFYAARRAKTHCRTASSGLSVALEGFLRALRLDINVA